MSFRISNRQPQVIPYSSPQQVINNGSIDIPGYYENNGVPINNSFYPALNTSSFGVNAVYTWTLRDVPVSSNWNAICWSPELSKFVIPPFGSETKCLNSSDGINWTSIDISNRSWTSVCWSPELRLFCAVAAFTPLSTDPRIMTSPDGVTWTTRISPIFNNWFGVCWSSRLSLFVAVGYGNSVITSSDGINWNLQSCSNNNWESVIYSSELRLFVSVASSGSNRVMTSSDGINWISRSGIPNNSWRSVTWSPELGLFASVADSGINNRVMTSSDGVNWIARTSAADNSWLGVTWSPQLRLFCAVSYDGVNRVMTSPDGITWTLRSASSPNWQGICWSPELGIFCAVAYDGSPGSSRVMTSSLQGRHPTSYNVFDSSFNNINQLGLWNFQSFGRGTTVNRDVSGLSLLPGQNWIDCSSALTIVMPTASLWPGREVMIRNIAANQILSNSSNIVQGDNTLSNVILSANAKKWVTLVSNGTNWVKVKGNDM
jgi:hypothetical protein